MILGSPLGKSWIPDDVRPGARLLEEGTFAICKGTDAFGGQVAEAGILGRGLQQGDPCLPRFGLHLVPRDPGNHLVAGGVPGVGRGACEDRRDDSTAYNPHVSHNHSRICGMPS